MKKIKLTQNKYVLIDDEDFDLVSRYKWRTHYDGWNWYAICNFKIVNGKRTTLSMHRLIMGLVRGDGKQIDHINHNGLDNRKCNLRICDNKHNQMNSRGQKNTTSKYKGVCWNSNSSKWSSSIKIDGLTLYLGEFDTEIDAAKFFDRVCLGVFGEFAYTNFPKSCYNKIEYLTTQQAVAEREHKRNLKLSSQFYGVEYHRASSKFRARCFLSGKEIYLGLFETELEAAIIRDQYIIDNNLKGKINFPKE